MSQTKPVIAVVGTGAVGGYYGGRLAQHGHDVHFLFRSEYEAVARKGLTVRSCHGDFSLPSGVIKAYRRPEDMPLADMVIVALKTTSNDAYEPLIRPLLKDNTAILTLQNGLGNEERLAELFGARRIMGGLAFVCINRVEPGVIHHIDYGLVRLGEFIENGPRDRLDATVGLFKDCKIECDALPSLRWGRWEKLIWNVPFSGLGAILDMTTDYLIASEAGVELIRAIMAEVIATARVIGVNLPDSVMDENVQRTRTMGPYKSSMHIDRQLRRPMEVEAILGEPARAAQRAGVAAPNLTALYRMAKLVNLGNLAASCDQSGHSSHSA